MKWKIKRTTTFQSRRDCVQSDPFRRDDTDTCKLDTWSVAKKIEKNSNKQIRNGSKTTAETEKRRQRTSKVWFKFYFLQPLRMGYLWFDNLIWETTRSDFDLNVALIRVIEATCTFSPYKIVKCELICNKGMNIKVVVVIAFQEDLC